MAIKTINELTAINTAGEDDYLLIAHKESDDSYTSKKIPASAVGGSGSSSGGSSGGAEMLIVEFTSSGNDITTETSVADIVTALNAGKIVQGKLAMSNDGDYIFANAVDVGAENVGFMFFGYNLDGDGKESAVVHVHGVESSGGSDTWGMMMYPLSAASE